MPPIAVGDYDGDGVLDVAAVSNASSAIQMKLIVSSCLGAGRFRDGQEVGVVPVGPDRLALGDVNEDGVLDLATSDGVHLGSVGDAQPDTPRGRDVVLADLDNDGHLDIATLPSYGDPVVHVEHGLGTGAFDMPADCPVPAMPMSAMPVRLVAAAIDGDAYRDVVVLHGDGAVSVLLNQGNGTFAPAVHYVTGAPSSSVQVDDVDGDCHADIVLALAALMGNGDGTFDRVEPLPAGLPGYVDNDAHVDLVAYPGVTRLGITGGTFGAPIASPLGETGWGAVFRGRHRR